MSVQNSVNKINWSTIIWQIFAKVDYVKTIQLSQDHDVILPVANTKITWNWLLVLKALTQSACWAWGAKPTVCEDSKSSEGFAKKSAETKPFHGPSMVQYLSQFWYWFLICSLVVLTKFLSLPCRQKIPITSAKTIP